MSTPICIDTYIRIPIHVYGLLINLCNPVNSLFVRDKSVKSGNRLHEGYAENRMQVKHSTARSKQHMRVVQWRLGKYIR